MKTALVLWTAVVLQNSLFAADITAVRNGSWTANSTWSLNRIPANGDVVLIPSGITVMLASAPYPKNNPAARPVLQIKIDGALDFSDPGNDKLYLNYGSVIQVFAGGKIFTTSNNPEIIAIYNGSFDNTVWSGDPNMVSGPVVASAATLGFAGSLLPVNVSSPASTIIHQEKNKSAQIIYDANAKLLKLKELTSVHERLYLCILNLNGKVILQNNLVNSNHSVSLLSVPQGIYIIQLRGDRNFSLTKKIMVRG